MKVKWLAPLSVTAIIIITIAVISWFAFPEWKKTEGGFATLLGIVIVSAVPVIKEFLSIVKEWNSIKGDEQTKTVQSINKQAPSKNDGQTDNSDEIKPILRRFIIESLSEQELREVISDNFSGLKLNISSRSSIREVADELANYAISQGKVEFLIEITSKYNPYQYNKYKKELTIFTTTLNDK